MAASKHFNTLSVRKFHGLGTNSAIDCLKSSFLNVGLIGTANSHIKFIDEGIEVEGKFKLGDKNKQKYSTKNPDDVPSNQNTRKIVTEELGGGDKNVFTQGYHTRSPRLLVRVGDTYLLTQNTTIDELYHYIQDTVDPKYIDKTTGALLLAPGEVFDGQNHWIHAASNNNQLSTSHTNKTYDGLFKTTTEQVQSGSEEAVTHAPLIRQLHVHLGKKSSVQATTQLPNYANSSGVIVSSRSPWIRCEDCHVRGHLTTSKATSSHGLGGFVGGYLGKKGFACMFMRCTVSGSSDIRGSGGFLGANMVSRTDIHETTPVLFYDCRVRMSLTQSAAGAGGFIGSDAFQSNATVRFLSCQVGQRAVSHEPLLDLDDFQDHVMIHAQNCGGLVGDYMGSAKNANHGSEIMFDSCSVDGITIASGGDGSGGLLGANAGNYSTITCTHCNLHDILIQEDNAGGMFGRDWNYSSSTDTSVDESTLTIQDSHAFLAEQSGTNDGSLLGNAEHTTKGTLSLARVTYSSKGLSKLNTSTSTFNYTETDIDAITKNHTSHMGQSLRDAALSGKLYANLRTGDPNVLGEVYIDHLTDGSLKVSGPYADEASIQGSSTIIATQSSTGGEKQKANTTLDGSNDTGAIQNAMDAMLTDLPEAGILYLASGTYFINSSQTSHGNNEVALKVPKGISIQGSHIGKTILKVENGKESAQTVIQMEDHARLYDLTIDMNATEDDSTRDLNNENTERGVLIAGALDTDIRNIEIKNSAGHGIELTNDPINPRIENVFITNTDLHAIRVASHSHTHNVDSQCRIRWCRIEDSGADAQDGKGAIEISGQYVYLDDISVRCTHTESGVVYLSGSSDNECRHLSVHNTKTHGVVCESNTQRISIDGCQLVAASSVRGSSSSSSSDRFGVELQGGSYHSIKDAYIEGFRTACNITGGSQQHSFSNIRVREGHQSVAIGNSTQQIAIHGLYADAMTGPVVVAKGTQHTLSEIHGHEVGYTSGSQSTPGKAPIPFDIQASHLEMNHFTLRNASRTIQFDNDTEETMVHVHGGTTKHVQLANFVLDAGTNQGIRYGVICDAVQEVILQDGMITECSDTFCWIKGSSSMCRVENVRFQHTNNSSQQSLVLASNTETCRVNQCYFFGGVTQIQGERHTWSQNRFQTIPTTAITVDGDKCYLNETTLHDVGDGQTDTPALLVNGNDVHLLNLELTAHTQSTKHCGIQIKGERAVIDGCTIEANCNDSLADTAVLNRGICVDVPSDIEAQCRIHNAFVYRCRQAGAYINSKQVYVIGSSFKDNQEYALYFTKNATHSVVSESSARNNGIFPPFWKHEDAIVIWGTNFGNNLPNELLRLTSGDSRRRQSVLDGPRNIHGYANWLSANTNQDGITNDIRNNNLADHLMHYVRFDEVSSSSGNNKVRDQVDTTTTINVSGLDIEASPHKVGTKSLRMGSTDDGLALPGTMVHHSTKDFTIALWVYPDNSDTDQTILRETTNTGTTDGTFVVSYTTNKQFKANVYDTNGNAHTLTTTSSSPPYEPTNWHLVELQRNGDTVTLNVNHDSDQQSATLNAVDANIAQHTNDDGQLGSSDFAGNIDGLAVWSRALTDKDRVALWNDENGLGLNDMSFQRKVHLSIGHGFEDGTRIDVGLELQLSRSLQWDAGKLTTGATNYLYLDYDERNEILTEGASKYAPLYRRARPLVQATEDNRFWYPVDHRHQGEVYDSASRTWTPILRVYVGQADVDNGGNVSNVIPYAYQGSYQSPIYDARGEGTTVFSHNIGTQRVQSQLFLRFKASATETVGYVPGDELALAPTQNASHLTYTQPNGLETVFSTAQSTFGNLPHANGDDVNHAPPWSDLEVFGEFTRSF
jgi:hypothetical protein